MNYLAFVPYSGQPNYGQHSPAQFHQTPSNPMMSSQIPNQQIPGPQNMNIPPQFSMFQQPLVQGMAIQYSQQLANTGKAMMNRWIIN